MEIEKILCRYPYAEARIENGEDSLVRIQDREIKVTSGSYFGISVRVLKNGSWGFASSNRMRDLQELLKKAERLASLEKGGISLAGVKPERKKVRRKIRRIAPDEQIRQLLEAKKEMEGKGIISQRMSCSDSAVKKEFYSSEGARIIQESNYTFLSCSAVAKDGQLIIRGSETSGSRTGFKALKLHETARISREKAERLLKAPIAPRGRFTVVLDPEMSGVFAHEALGHAAEADSVVDRESILSSRIGKKIGSELVSVVDDPREDSFGGYVFDDEGIKARKTMILEKGVLKSFLNSRETAKKTKKAPNGHARAGGYDEVPIVRMSNTFILPGKYSRKDVFDVKKGIYIKGMRGGSVDIFSGGFMFKAEEAYEIRNGETGRVMRDAAISGNVLKTLNSVEAVGKDFGTSPGMCGKGGQEVPVSDGGPHLRVRNVMVG